MQGVMLTFKDGTEQHFDEVVFACHSDQALALMSDPTDNEQTILGAMTYKSNEVVLHTDASLLPKRQRTWSSWNYWLRQDTQDNAVLSYNMNILQGLDSDTTFCVTLNASDAIAPEKIINTFHYSHPVFTQASVAMSERWPEINGVNRTWFAGAYWGNGFHEDGISSGKRVAKAINARKPKALDNA
jgi:predicted NAD/FAD-binding protein